MAGEDEVRTEASSSSSSSSFIRDSQESDDKRDVLSPEDIAWIDSCLIKESVLSEGDWNSMKDALLEVLSSQPGLNPSASVTDRRPADNDIEMLASREDPEPDRALGMEEETEEITRTPIDIIHVRKEAESRTDNSPTEGIDDLLLQAFAGNQFLPSYVDDLKETRSNETSTDTSSLVDEVEPSANEIFRVWDLNIPAEENELDKQLNMIFEESNHQSEPSVVVDDDDGSSAGKDLKEESLDELIAAISEISLK